MSEAKDTIMDADEMLVCSLISEYPFRLVRDVIEETCKHQAEISFKMGIKEVVDWLDLPHYFVQVIKGDRDDGSEDQIWLVDVRYIEEVANSRGAKAYYLRKIGYKCLQAKLKSWGIDEK